MPKKFQKILLTSCLAFLISGSAIAQPRDAPSFWQNEIVSARFHYGVVMAHHPYLKSLVTGHIYGFEFDLFHQADGSKAWHAAYNLPQTGFIFIHLDLANPDILGNADALMYAINFPFSSSAKTFQSSFRLGCGMGWLSKKFDRIENHKEIAIGSNLNAAIQLSFELKAKFSSRFSGNFDFGLTHFSNGAFTYPNLGINNVTSGIGVNYALTKIRTETKRIETTPLDNKLQYNLILAAGERSTNIIGNKTYFSSTLSFTALKQLNNQRLLGIGADVFYDPGLKRQLTLADIPVHDFDAVRSGFYIDHEQLIGKTAIITQVGIYIINPYKDDGMIYDRIGFKYRCTEKYFINLTLKTHTTKADYVEWGVGIKM